MLPRGKREEFYLKKLSYQQRKLQALVIHDRNKSVEQWNEDGKRKPNE
jgi:hypothetical protein